jgi:hypothetical protein
LTPGKGKTRFNALKIAQKKALNHEKMAEKMDESSERNEPPSFFETLRVLTVDVNSDLNRDHSDMKRKYIKARKDIYLKNERIDDQNGSNIPLPDAHDGAEGHFA